MTARRKASDAVDAQLERYRSMRDFAVTREPSGSAKTGTSQIQLPFVIQKHAASHLHYDFRLGWNGVLKSWAVAKGPSYNTKDKRLAVEVEDHPVEYGGFEGIIPPGQYGGGTVMVWDEGTWEPQEGQTDVDAGLRDGSLKFILHGTKMRGKWALVRMKDKTADQKKHNWLLIKEHDAFERGEKDQAVTEADPDSVVTHRSIEEIAHNGDHVWQSKAAAEIAIQKQDEAQPVPSDNQRAEDAAVKKKPRTKAGNPDSGARLDLGSWPAGAMPQFVAPQLAVQADAAPAGEGWLHEFKLDGYRIQAHKNGGTVHLYTRTGLDWTHRMKGIADAIAKLSIDQGILDGEVVVLAEDGTTSFADLQASFQDSTNRPLTYFVFDLLHANGHDLRDAPLIERKKVLDEILNTAGDAIRFSEHIAADGAAIFNKACELHAEGIVSKRANAPYKSGRTSDWVKIKCIQEQEFVVGGFTLPSNGSHGVGALLLGYFDDTGKLIYAGRTGTGFTQASHHSTRDALDKLRTAKMAFESVPREMQKGVIWIRPKLVAQVRFATWTADKLVRQASFKGLREDKPAKDVRREMSAEATGGTVAKQATHRETNGIAARSVSPRKIMGETSVPAAVRLTHPDKIVDPESGLTKQQLAEYYWKIAEYMLPDIAHRPLSLVRCPDGTASPCFFQKHTNAMLPKDIDTVEIVDKKSGKPEPYITLSTREALAGLAQMGVLELHPWGSKNDDLEHPDRMIIDLDPDSSIAWETLAESARQVRGLFKKIGLESFLKSTGGKGLHIVVPVIPGQAWPAIKEFAHAFAMHLEKMQPSLYLTRMSKAARAGRIFVDYLRNERGATAVAVYSPRARAGAPVSVPLEWSELDLAERPVFHVADFDVWKSRLSRSTWKKLLLLRQAIDSDKVRAVLNVRLVR